MLDQLREHGSEILSRADAGPVARTRCGQSSFTIVSPGKTACKSRFWPFSIQIVLASTMHYHADLEWVRTAFRNFSRTVVTKINAMGHWVDRSEHVNLNELFERMTREEMEAYAKEGTLPAWFEEAVGATDSDGRGTPDEQ